MKNKNSNKQLNFVQISGIAYIDSEPVIGNYPSVKMLAESLRSALNPFRERCIFVTEGRTNKDQHSEEVN